jgi:bifunctional non-homologous end joining protein LigD
MVSDAMARSGDAGARSVGFTHLDRVYWPELGLTKAGLVQYYRALAPTLLPHLRDRPFTIKRHYTVPRGPFEWIKDAPPEAPPWVRTTAQPARSRAGAAVHYVLVNDEPTLLWLVEFGAVDLHVWPSRIDRPEHPDFVLFDLDPAGVPFADVVRAAQLVGDALSGLGLDAVAMTTGGEGMHVRVPVARVHDHAQAREFVRVVGLALGRASDGLITLERRIERRQGVFLDAKMNGHGQQIVAPYSVRPLSGAPVATPLAWAEVGADLDPAAFVPPAVEARVRRHGDLAAPLLHGRRRLARALAAL